jgi:DNA-binding GntR family transcriptional regulator
VLALPEQRSLHDVVAERLVAAIAAGELVPGERLVELKLAARLGISRAPLREALKQLEAKGLVESRRGRGTYVRDVSAADIEQMTMVRAMLEGLAARLCAAHANDSQLAELRHLHGRIELAYRQRDVDTWRRLDWDFHEMVCRFSGNGVLLASWRALSSQLRLFLVRNVEADTVGDVAIGYHREYIAALLARDGDRAETAFRASILAFGFDRLGRDVPQTLAAYMPSERGNAAPGSIDRSLPGPIEGLHLVIGNGGGHGGDLANHTNANGRANGANARGGGNGGT